MILGSTQLLAMQASDQAGKSQYSAWISSTHFEGPGLRPTASSTDSEDDDEVAESNLRPAPNQLHGSPADLKHPRQYTPWHSCKQPTFEQKYQKGIPSSGAEHAFTAPAVKVSCSKDKSSDVSKSHNAVASGGSLGNEVQQACQQVMCPPPMGPFPHSMPPVCAVGGKRKHALIQQPSLTDRVGGSANKATIQHNVGLPDAVLKIPKKGDKKSWNSDSFKANTTVQQPHSDTPAKLGASSQDASAGGET